MDSTSPLPTRLPRPAGISALSTSPRPPNTGECELLGPFALLIQSSLGITALLALVYKRYRERPQRPPKVWFFDVSKQLFGGVCVHVANLLMSMLSSGQFSVRTTIVGAALQPPPPPPLQGGQMHPGHKGTEAADVVGKVVRSVVRRLVQESYVPNPCSFYLLNLAIDTTLGIPILIFLLRLLTALFALTSFGVPRESIESGHYGHPPRAWWWFKQSIIYFLGLMGMKICVLIIFVILPVIHRVGDWALGWTEGNEALQVVFVMLIFPVTMNAIQYYIIDSYIKSKSEHHALLPNSESHADAVETCRDVRDMNADEDSDADEDNSVERQQLHENSCLKPSQSHSTDVVEPKMSPCGIVEEPKQALRRNLGDYDPLRDGASSPAVGSTSGIERDPHVERHPAARDSGAI